MILPWIGYVGFALIGGALLIFALKGWPAGHGPAG